MRQLLAFARCKADSRLNVFFSAVCVAALFIVASTQVRVEWGGNRVRIHFPAAWISAFDDSPGIAR